MSTQKSETHLTWALHCLRVIQVLLKEEGPELLGDEVEVSLHRQIQSQKSKPKIQSRALVGVENELLRWGKVQDHLRPEIQSRARSSEPKDTESSPGGGGKGITTMG
ncbi:hypothetical protein AMTR_s00078p00153010 [Amborella trichopoda]|uniref:Uncharacterized protein n=1 Tax=Amborella trichopoda TaxID=13333 RepID=W1P850_AMBTC|nr:hypothetical protein AMTR_s00078p00153010 [Amborella trichopoda]